MTQRVQTESFSKASEFMQTSQYHLSSKYVEGGRTPSTLLYVIPIVFMFPNTYSTVQQTDPTSVGVKPAYTVSFLYQQLAAAQLQIPSTVKIEE